MCLSVVVSWPASASAAAAPASPGPAGPAARGAARLGARACSAAAAAAAAVTLKPEVAEEERRIPEVVVFAAVVGPVAVGPCHQWGTSLVGLDGPCRGEEQGRGADRPSWGACSGQPVDHQAHRTLGPASWDW